MLKTEKLNMADQQKRNFRLLMMSVISERFILREDMRKYLKKLSLMNQSYSGLNFQVRRIAKKLRLRIGLIMRLGIHTGIILLQKSIVV